MARAGEDDVRAIISTDTALDLGPFIRTAAALTEAVDTCDTDNVLSSQQLRQIETWLAAHFYAHRDQLYLEKKTEKASAIFQGKTGMHLDSTQYGQTAMIIDTTGCLSDFNQDAKVGRRKATLAWLGKAPSDQTDYRDRD